MYSLVEDINRIGEGEWYYDAIEEKYKYLSPSCAPIAGRSIYLSIYIHPVSYIYIFLDVYMYIYIYIFLDVYIYIFFRCICRYVSFMYHIIVILS